MHVGLAAGFGALGAVLLAIALIYLTGCAPRWVLTLEARLIRLFKRRKPWNWNQVDERIFVGSLPRWPEHLSELRAHGVGAVLSLNETWELALSVDCVRDQCGMAARQLATPDFFAPTQRDLVDGVAFIGQQIAAGRGVYVHCNGGRGRSAACVICYLVYAHGLTADEAFELVRSKRKIANLKALHGLRTQWRAIKRFERDMHAARAHVAARERLDDAHALAKPKVAQVVASELVGEQTASAMRPACERAASELAAATEMANTGSTTVSAAAEPRPARVGRGDEVVSSTQSSCVSVLPPLAQQSGGTGVEAERSALGGSGWGGGAHRTGLALATVVA
jgi:atypical dual specificity phosphatase